MELYFGETLLKKDSKIIVPEKRNNIFFLEFSFGETLLKKDFQNYSSEKKRNYIFFRNYLLAKHSFVSTLVAN